MDAIKVISTAISEAKKLIKFERRGKSDIREKLEASPYGLDSNPIKDTRGVFTETTLSGQGVVVGYVNTNQKSDVGEFRTYATDSNGNEVFYSWMKNDGTMEIGGDADNMVRFSELKTAFDQLKNDFDSLVNTYNGHDHIVPQAPSGSTTSAPPLSQGSGTTADIDPAKIDEIKTL